MEEYKDKASFEEFFKQNYVPLDYKSIRNEMREAAGDGWSLFTDEYKFRGKIDKKDFIVHMTGDAYCTFEEIVENDYNLNIPRYVDTFEEEEVEPLTEIVAKINQTNATIESQTASLLDMLGQLHGTTPEADEELKAFVEAFKG